MSLTNHNGPLLVSNYMRIWRWYALAVDMDTNSTDVASWGKNMIAYEKLRTVLLHTAP